MLVLPCCTKEISTGRAVDIPSTDWNDSCHRVITLCCSSERDIKFNPSRLYFGMQSSDLGSAVQVIATSVLEEPLVVLC